MTIFEAIEAGMDHVNHLGGVSQAIRDDNAEENIRFFKERGTVVDPTMAWGELTGHPLDMPAAEFEPGMLKAPYQLASLINTAGNATVDRAAFARRQSEQFSAIRTLHAAGIPIVAGTDKALPGHSLHRELELYVQAGLKPLDAIRAASIVAARAMGLDKEVGTIEPGKRADLILVNGNPLQNIHDIRKVSRVVTNGRMYDSAELWKIVGFK
jgi:imidazolonepropionase-like amidohydrolase